MKKGVLLHLCTLMLVFISGNLLAQQDYEYHPALSDNFMVSLGIFKSDNSFTVAANGVINPDEDQIDFDDKVGVDSSSTLFNGQLRWKFGKQRKWSLWGQYFKNDATGEAVLEEDVEWQDIIFREGTFVEAGVKMEIVRVFVGRSLVKNPQHDFGIGIGVHNLSLGAFIEGEILIDDGTTEFRQGDVSNSQPLPNVGTWWDFSPARNWLIHARVDWISANVGDLNGTLWNTVAGVNYQAFRNVGFDLSYQFFNLNLKVDSAEWIGEIDMRYSGPVLSVTANW
ncbi:MAG: hypothetical protein BMS9Abin30_0243 [Gammaproteobacteria bacterium]|nr:MAG: hypothetical protein BMS9Abin30_0243 [Gammaproteobacteria bacterium]